VAHAPRIHASDVEAGSRPRVPRAALDLHAPIAFRRHVEPRSR
jgi:hypothetical protein